MDTEQVARGTLSGGRIVATLLLVGAFTLVAALVVLQVTTDTSSFVVLSGSMEPRLQPGDLIVLRPVAPAAIEPGDIITYHAGQHGAAGRELITHRVVETTREAGDFVFRTQGDANPTVDPTPVDQSQVVGRLWISLPQVGHALLIAQRPLAQLLGVVVPGVGLIAGGSRTLYRCFIVNETTRDGE